MSCCSSAIGGGKGGAQGGGEAGGEWYSGDRGDQTNGSELEDSLGAQNP